MITLKPELQNVTHTQMKTTDPRHIGNAGKVGFSGSFDHGGAITDFSKLLTTQTGVESLSGQGAEIAALGRATGASSVLRDSVYGLDNAGGVSFSEEMLKAIDKVSGMDNRASALVQEAITNPGSVDPHDVTIAEASAVMSLNIARTILNRLTQAWRDIINTR